MRGATTQVILDLLHTTSPDDYSMENTAEKTKLKNKVGENLEKVRLMTRS